MQIFRDIELWVASQSSMLLYPKCIQVKEAGIHRGCPLGFCLIATPKAAPFPDGPLPSRGLSLMTVMMATMATVTALFEYKDVLR